MKTTSELFSAFLDLVELNQQVLNFRKKYQAWVTDIQRIFKYWLLEYSQKSQMLIIAFFYIARGLLEGPSEDWIGKFPMLLVRLNQLSLSPHEGDDGQLSKI